MIIIYQNKNNKKIKMMKYVDNSLSYREMETCNCNYFPKTACLVFGK